MKFEWDPRKATRNLRKHRVSFEQATTAFRDPLSVTAPDLAHSSSEYRFVTFGLSSTGKLLTISHTEQGIHSNHPLDELPSKRKRSMKKADNSELDDWGKANYKRADLGEIVRGKYAKRIRESTNVVVLDPQVAKAFPNDEAVNSALLGLIRSTRSAGKLSMKRKNKVADKKRAA